jgi:hypothetical protein
MGKNKGQWQDHRNTAGNTDQPYQPENAISVDSSEAEMNTPQTTDTLSSPLESGDLATSQASLSANSPSTPPPTPDSANLTDFVARLSPEQLSRVRALAASAGLSTGPQRGPNGGLLVTVEIPVEACEPLAEWARESGASFQEFVSKVAGDAIVNYCFGDWSAVREAPAPVVATPVTVAP